jgi:disulfide bond formation protein DsbB
MQKFLVKNYAYISWLTSLAALFGSLFFSEILHYPPCILCWYQRIFMYPLTILIPVGIMKKDKYLPYYILPLAILGALVAFYHNLLYYKIIPDTLSPCSLGVSCTTKFIEFFGFVTIPFLSLCAFSVIIISTWLNLKFKAKS